MLQKYYFLALKKMFPKVWLQIHFIFGGEDLKADKKWDNFPHCRHFAVDADVFTEETDASEGYFGLGYN